MIYQLGSAFWEDLDRTQNSLKNAPMLRRYDDNTPKLKVYLKHIREIENSLAILIEGSTTGGTRDSRTGALATHHSDPVNPEVLHTLQQYSSRIQTSSFDEVFMAIEMALQWVHDFLHLFLVAYY